MLPSRGASFGLSALPRVKDHHQDRPTHQGDNRQSKMGETSTLSCDYRTILRGWTTTLRVPLQRTTSLATRVIFLPVSRGYACHQMAGTCYRGWKTGVSSVASAVSIAIVGRPPFCFPLGPGLAEAWQDRQSPGKFPTMETRSTEKRSPPMEPGSRHRRFALRAFIKSPGPRNDATPAFPSLNDL
jgi:hypothetical protein